MSGCYYHKTTGYKVIFFLTLGLVRAVRTRHSNLQMLNTWPIFKLFLPYRFKYMHKFTSIGLVLLLREGEQCVGGGEACLMSGNDFLFRFVSS